MLLNGLFCSITLIWKIIYSQILIHLSVSNKCPAKELTTIIAEIAEPKCPAPHFKVLPKLTAKLNSTMTKLSDIIAPLCKSTQDNASEFIASASEFSAKVIIEIKEILLTTENILIDIFTNEYVIVGIFDGLVLFLMGMQRILPKSLFVNDKKDLEARPKRSLSAAMKIGNVRRRRKNRR